MLLLSESVRSTIEHLYMGTEGLSNLRWIIKISMDSYPGHSEDQERLRSFSDWCLFTSLSRAEQTVFPPVLCGNPGGSNHIHASMVCLKPCLQIRKKQTKISNVLSERGLEEGVENKGSMAATSLIF